MLFQEMILLKQLIKGERKPANGMEIHFLRVMSGDASPCSEKEKEWHQYWLKFISKTDTESAIKNAKSELDSILAILYSGGKLQSGLTKDWSFNGMHTLDFFFHYPRLGIKIDYENSHDIKHLLNDVEKELILEHHGITLARFTEMEIFGDRKELLKKVNQYWNEAISKQRQAEKKAKQQEATIAASKTDRANPSAKSRRRGKRSDSAFLGGWTSLSQGERGFGDTKPKRYINEGIAGTRDENKKMRGQLWGDMRNRGRGR